MKFAKIITCLTISFLCACQSQPLIRSGEIQAASGESSPFVSVEGTHFIRNGSTYVFVGANMWYGAYLGASENGRERLRNELDVLARHGITNLRILALSENTEQSMAVSPAIQVEPGILNEDLLVGLDYLLDEMAKRDMLAVLYLNNFWQWSGGMSQYRAWSTAEPPVDPDKSGDWNGFMQYSAQFYSDEQAQLWYRLAIDQLVNRINSISGLAYSQDPTIMAWQLANEPRPGSQSDGRANAQAYVEWIKSTAQYIKSLDSRHLVSVGSEGEMGTLQDIELYRQSHDSEFIDYFTFHLWPKNWSWFDIRDLDGTYQSALAKAKSYIYRHSELAHNAGKPAVLEEFGIQRDHAAYDSLIATQTRDRFFKEIYDLIETQVKVGGALAGSNFWAWGGVGQALHQDYIWRPGDPFTGDPPQEPQGLFSVFATDQSTLDLVKKHAAALND